MQEVTAGQGAPADVLSYVESCLLVLTFPRVGASGCESKPRHDLPDHSLQETERRLLLVTIPSTRTHGSDPPHATRRRLALGTVRVSVPERYGMGAYFT